MIQEAIVLAGGFGTRLKSVVSDVPKPMALVNDQPFLTYLLTYLSRNSIDRVILATGHLHDKLAAYYGNSLGSLAVEYSREQQPLGTGGAVRLAMGKTTEPEVVVVNGDTFFDVPLHNLTEYHHRQDADMTISLKPMPSANRYGTVELDNERIVRFRSKGDGPAGLINGGVYIIRTDLFERFPMPEVFSLESDFLSSRAIHPVLAGFVSDSFFLDIGIPEDLERAQTEMKRYA